MLTFAWKSLWRDRVRFGLTMGGVALSVLLMLVMNGLFASSGRQITAYIDQSEADLFVAQAGVRNMHMASSALPLSVGDALRKVSGVEGVEPILYFPTTLEWQGESDTLYAIALEESATMGGPWKMANGSGRPGAGEVVISDRQRGRTTPALGEQVKVSGKALEVVGWSQETKSLASSLVFLSFADAATMRGKGVANYFLIKVAPGAEPNQVGEAMQRQVDGVEVMTRESLSLSDRDLALQMGVEILGIMAAVGFVIALAVVALTIHMATVEQMRQYGVLKALGADSVHLVTAVAGQGLISSTAGFLLGVGLTLLLRWGLPWLAPGLEIDLPLGYGLRIFGLILAIGGLAALIPARRVQRVDPVDVFRA